jgi:hypothetical protein
MKMLWKDDFFHRQGMLNVEESRDCERYFLCSFVGCFEDAVRTSVEFLLLI